MSGERRLSNGLTKRQDDVIRLMLHGLTNADISRILDVHEQTIDRHITSARLALGARNRVDLALKWLAKCELGEALEVIQGVCRIDEVQVGSVPKQSPTFVATRHLRGLLSSYYYGQRVL